jgi:hypothetical protein
MRAIRTSGSEGGAGCHIPAPTPIAGAAREWSGGIPAAGVGVRGVCSVRVGEGGFPAARSRPATRMSPLRWGCERMERRHSCRRGGV